MISLKTHNILDYVGGFALILVPYLFGFADVDVARNVLGFLGVSLVVYSLLTDYRYSFAKAIPLGVHMFLDSAVGVLVLLAPSIWDYRAVLTGTQNAAHYVLGIGLIAMVAFTRRGRAQVGATEQEPIPIRRVA